MLWLALHFPHLPLQSLLRGHASPECCAVCDGRTVLDCDSHARALGVRVGMDISAAQTLAPQLLPKRRCQSAEQEALQGIAAWMCAFTPNVSLEPPAGLLAEIRGSLLLFGGVAGLTKRVREGLLDMGFSAFLASAPTARGAWWLARAGHETLVEDRTVLHAALPALPVTAMCMDRSVSDLLHAIGICTIRDLLELPREGVTRRFGRALLENMDRAFGKFPEPRAFFKLSPRFSVKIDLPGEVMHAEGVLFAARRLLIQLEGVLLACQAGIFHFDLCLLSRRAPSRTVRVGLATPAREAERLLQLLRERLDTVNLTHPVEALRLDADDFAPLGGHTSDLFDDSYIERESWARLVERLQARLGSHALCELATHADHRPEFAWSSGSIQEQSLERNVRQHRPLWLITPPRRLREVDGIPYRDGPLDLLAGPERIESGWWDGRDVARDYFIARTQDFVRLWIFRERPDGGWYLHGIFS